MIHLHELGYGWKKGIPSTLIAASTFDNIATLIWFGIVNAITFSKADAMIKGTTPNIGMTIAWLFIQVIIGFAVGIVVGLTAWFFKFITWKHSIYLKTFYCVSIAVGFVLASDFSGQTNAKFMASLTFGYTCSRFWGHQKPAKQIAQLWIFIQPWLFGTIGAALIFS